MRRTFCDPGQALAHLQNMVHRLVGQPVVRQGVEAADTGEQGPVIFPRTSSIHILIRCQVPAGI